MKTIQISKENWQKITVIRREYYAKTNNDIITALIDLYEQYMQD